MDPEKHRRLRQGPLGQGVAWTQRSTAAGVRDRWIKAADAFYNGTSRARDSLVERNRTEYDSIVAGTRTRSRAGSSEQHGLF